jgi:hypothetical protein
VSGLSKGNGADEGGHQFWWVEKNGFSYIKSHSSQFKKNKDGYLYAEIFYRFTHQNQNFRVKI